jgi:hypothetical protein
MYNCGMAAKLTQQQFIKNAMKIHGDTYDYSLVDYKSANTKVTIICPQHGVFEQIPKNHTTRKAGCPKCVKKHKPSATEFAQQAKKIHGNVYNYSQVEYLNTRTKVTIICPKHGPFEQQPKQHLKGSGCPTCAGKTIQTKSQFVKQATITHGTKYDYSLVDYNSTNTKVKIICPKHGVFEQIPKDHKAGRGCQRCGIEITKSHTTRISKGELEIAEFITSLDVDVEQSNVSIISPYELDIYVPEHNIAVEYCGLYWHSEQVGRGRKYHKMKHDMCAEQNIQLLTIFEDEWKDRNQQVRNKIKQVLGVSTAPTVFARKTTITSVDIPTRTQFFNNNHIQGAGTGSLTYGLLAPNDDLVACVVFKRRSQGVYELTRYATSCRVPGGFSKLVKHFQRNNVWTTIISFADLRWSSGQMYEQNGWTLDSAIPPDYYYSPNAVDRIHKFNYRRKNLPSLLKHFDPTLSETQNCDNNGILRIWDCGKLRYVLNNHNTTQTSKCENVAEGGTMKDSAPTPTILQEYLL